MLGDTADTLAATAVARAAKGQGHLLGDVGVPEVGFAYAMRDLGKDWVQAYAQAIGRPEETDGGGEGTCQDSVDDKNVHDLARGFAVQLLESNPGGVSNIMGTVGKLDQSRGHDTCALCEEVLCEEELDNRCGTCDACTTGVFADWRDEEAAMRTVSSLPESLRARFFDLDRSALPFFRSVTNPL